MDKRKKNSTTKIYENYVNYITMWYKYKTIKKQ